MKQFWLMTYSATTALGWVAFAQTSGQAMDENALDNGLEDATPAPVLAAEPTPAIEVNVAPPAPIPAVEPTWTVPEPQPQTSYIEPAPADEPELSLPEPTPLDAVTPEVAPEVEPVTPQQSGFIEQDPVLRAVINPETPEAAAMVEELAPEDVIRDGRSFEELLSSSPPAPEFTPPQRSVPTAAPVPASAPAPVYSSVERTPLLNQLEQDLLVIQQSGSVESSGRFTLPEPKPSAIEVELAALEAELLAAEGLDATDAIALDLNSELPLSAWDVATMGATFTRNDFNIYAFATDFWADDWQNTDWQNLSFETLDTFETELLADLDATEWTVDFADLETGTDGLLAEFADLPTDRNAAVPLPSFQSSGELALDFSAFDPIAAASPLGVNPLTFGYPEDELVASVVDGIISSR